MRHASRFRQIQIYTGKCLRAFVNEKGWKNLVSTLLIMILIVNVIPDDMFRDYSSTRNGCSAVICAGIWIGVFNSIQSICRERDIVKREHRAGLHMSAYVASHMIYEMILCFAEALIVNTVFLMGTPSYYFTQMTVLPVWIDFFITFFLLIYSSDVLGIMISSIVRTPNTAMTVMPFVLIIELVMCGYIFHLEGFSETISNLTVSKWTMYALCTIADVNALDDYIPKYAAYYLHTPEHLHNMWGILILFTLIYGAIAVISLEFIDRDKR
jgi:hypothetical protein